MYILTVAFDPELALAKTSEVLALEDSPERLAEKLNVTKELPQVKEGVNQRAFRRLIEEVDKLKKYLDIEKEIDEVQSPNYKLRFLGSTFREGQLVKLNEAKRKLGSLIEAPRWFYKQPRVNLLSAIRDFALDGSMTGNPEWIDTGGEPLPLPLADMFETGNLGFARSVASELEKRFRDVSPKFLLEKFEGHRSIKFDFATKQATFYTPVRSS